MSKKAYDYKSVYIPAKGSAEVTDKKLNVEFNKGFELHTQIREDVGVRYILRRERDKNVPAGSVVLKMECFAKSEVDIENDSTEYTFNFNAVVSGSPENDEFFEYTPAANLTMSCVNKSAAEMLESGKEYYVYLVEA